MLNDNKLPNYFGILPANVRYDNDLRPNAKLLYSELTCLTSKEGYCFASNNYFAELYGVDPSAISKWIKQLADKGYISVEYIYNGKECKERRIAINQQVLPKEQEGIAKSQEGYCQKNKDNNTSINNINNNNTSNMASAEKAPINPFILKDSSNWYLSKDLYLQFKETYSNLDVDFQLKKMQMWLISNPVKRKTPKGMIKFINNWLSNTKDFNIQNNYQQKVHTVNLDNKPGLEEWNGE